MDTREYNVQYNRGDNTFSIYLKDWVTRGVAEHYRLLFIREYVGQPYPNGKGFYPFHSVEVVYRDK